MSELKDDGLLEEALGRPSPAIAYSLSRQLRNRFPNRCLLEGDSETFDLDVFAFDGHCQISTVTAVHTQMLTGWDAVMTRKLKQGWLQVRWEGHDLDVLLLSWPAGFCDKSHYWILADQENIARAFFSAVCTWCAEVRGEVLVFDGGSWEKDPELFASIQGTTFDNLVLAGNLKQQIRDDLTVFLQSQTTYRSYGVPWKRGILFVGPPGNGKTHAVKALINHAQQPCLYVKSFKHRFSTDHDAIRAVFKRARQTTPCILVFEDLDSLIDSGNRSFFLNELDGFAANTGIITLATTNHPERLDPAILERPSRFDRKYHFELPAVNERRAYLASWETQLSAELRIGEGGIERLAELTEGFSFAYLKELVLSSTIRWIGAPGSEQMATLMESQVVLLREQMETPEPEPSEDDADE